MLIRGATANKESLQPGRWRNLPQDPDQDNRDKLIN